MFLRHKELSICISKYVYNCALHCESSHIIITHMWLTYVVDHMVDTHNRSLDVHIYMYVYTHCMNITTWLLAVYFGEHLTTALRS